MGNEVADASVWQARAAAWELAALSLRYLEWKLIISISVLITRLLLVNY